MKDNLLISYPAYKLYMVPFEKIGDCIRIQVAVLLKYVITNISGIIYKLQQFMVYFLQYMSINTSARYGIHLTDLCVCVCLCV